MRAKKKVFRPFAWFIFPDSEREEPFLNKESQNGWHLLKTSYWSYTFQKGEPVEYQYRMDYVSKKLGRGEYMQLLQDAGWEIVGTRRDEIGLWAYCRRPRSDDEILELYTDAESKQEAARRISRAFWQYVVTSFLLLALISVLVALLGREWNFWGSIIGGLIGAGIATTIGGIAVWRKIKRVKNDTL